ncbi:unnamed protein product [Soboliphyme baturini]|uniref:Peptidase M12A domain-containing protein n=1 Tax=Soboliphyme baturini TaxID=241478 RepID=A0A183IAP0_9BILA|nr:unnamed protein product [Soboliphyme baturini]
MEAKQPEFTSIIGTMRHFSQADIRKINKMYCPWNHFFGRNPMVSFSLPVVNDGQSYFDYLTKQTLMAGWSKYLELCANFIFTHLLFTSLLNMVFSHVRVIT